MEIDSSAIKNIMESNFQYMIVDTPVGEAIQMSAKDAFLFSNVTGAGYLDDSTYPFSPKGYMITLREAFKYNLVTGLFDNDRLNNTPLYWQKRKPFLFENNKYLIPVDCASEKQFSVFLSKSYEKLISANKKTTDYIFFKVETWKNGNGMECFLEYLACEYFKRHGYMVMNQVPLTQDVGSPDFGGFLLNNRHKGFYLAELSMISVFNDYDLLDLLNFDGFIVGEAKTATTEMAGQLAKYMNTGIYKKGYELHPDKVKSTYPYYGLLNLDNNNKIRVIEPQEQYDYSTPKFDYQEYCAWFLNYLKFFIAANLLNEDLKDFVTSKKLKGKYTQKMIIEAIKSSPIEEIVLFVKEKR